MAKTPAPGTMPLRLTRGIELRVMAANLVAAIFVFVYLTFLSRTRTGPRSTGGDLVSLAIFVVYVGTCLVVAHVATQRFARPIEEWLVSDRLPTDEERDTALRGPWRYAGWPAVAWVVAAALFGVLNATVLGNSAARGVQVAVGTLLGGVTTVALGYLLVERGLRPLIARALAGDPPDQPASLGVRSRLLLSWALGSGVPLVALVLAATGLGADRAAGRVPIICLGAAAIITGLVVTVAAARSVADPIDDVRRGLRRVQAGDVDVEIPVDDAGEVGLLQSGFNAMVSGLRERQRLEELFGRHVGLDVARQALEQDAGLGGQQLDASALFVDLIGSTGLAERLPPARVVALLNAMFDAVVRVVDAEGGWVNKFEGDGAVCVFGAPVPVDDHAARALRAARRLRRELVALGDEHPGLDAAVGVSSGTVVAGNVGSMQRYEYTVIGNPVNEAARLTDLAKGRPTRVMAAEQSVRSAGDEAGHWRPSGVVTLRGRTEPTCAYELGGD
jgi:adenylate cyclase